MCQGVICEGWVEVNSCAGELPKMLRVEI